VRNWFETPLGQAKLDELQAAAETRVEKAKKSAVDRNRYNLRSYYAAKSTRFTDGWQSQESSADSELVNDLRVLRGRSRALCRDSSYAKRARSLCVANIIGTGIGMQAQVETTRGEKNARVNDEIEERWWDWGVADSCHVGGRLTFTNMEQQAVGQVFEAGEVFFRKHYVPFGNSRIPFALELIESERVADDYQVIGPIAPNSVMRMGIELDKFYRPIAYWFRERHRNDVRWLGEPDRLFRVPANEIIHVSVLNRWPQTRGEPWMHTAMRRMNDMDAYVEAEVIKARGHAMRMGVIETPEGTESLGTAQPDGNVEMEMEAGEVFKLNPGETWKDSISTSPNPQLDPFMRYLCREMAVGVGISYASVSGDYSQSNYSSSRLSLLDDRDLWRVLQTWFIEQFRQKVHNEWLRQAVLSRAIESIRVEEYGADQAKFEAVRFRPRGWGWVDPTKEVQAFKDAVRSNFMTLQDVLAMSGADVEEVLEQRAEEVELTKSLGLVSDADPGQVSQTGQEQKPEASDDAKPADGEESTEPDGEAPQEPAARRPLHLITRK